MTEFVCARCGEPFHTETTGIASVCDDCYEFVIALARADGLI